MRKISFILIAVIFAALWWAMAYDLLSKREPIAPGDISQSWTWAEIWTGEQIKNVPQEVVESPKNLTKLEQLKIKYNMRWLLHEWNYFFDNEQYPLALKSYLEVFAKTDDNRTAESIADTYFAMKQFSPAYKYYLKVDAPDTQEKAFISLLFHTNVETPENLWILYTEIENLHLSDAKKFFYKNSLDCLKDFHICKTHFESYFYGEQEKPLDENLTEIKSTIDNYTNFKIDDLKYKNALLIWTYYKLWLYPIVIKIWKDLLQENPEYTPVVLMIAQSYFELWDYENAKKYIVKYNQLQENDKDAYYLLGVIELKNHEYVLSNIYFNKALELGYEPRINAKRRLIYNYQILWQDEKLLQEFSSLVHNEESIEKEDIYTAIYYHIIYEKNKEALELAKLGIKKFPQDAQLYGYTWWVLKDMWDYENALKYLLEWIKIDPKNPLVNLYLWLTYIENGEKIKSIVYLKQTIKENENGEFWKKAQEELIKLSIPSIWEEEKK